MYPCYVDHLNTKVSIEHEVKFETSASLAGWVYGGHSKLCRFYSGQTLRDSNLQLQRCQGCLKRGSLDHDGRAAGMLTLDILDATSGCSIFTKLKMKSSIQLGKTGSFMLFATICKWPKLETGKWHGTPCKQ